MELSYHWPEQDAADNFLYAHLHQALAASSESFRNLTVTVLRKGEPASRSHFWDALCAHDELVSGGARWEGGSGAGKQPVPR